MGHVTTHMYICQKVNKTACDFDLQRKVGRALWNLARVPFQLPRNRGSSVSHLGVVINLLPFTLAWADLELTTIRP